MQIKIFRRERLDQRPYKNLIKSHTQQGGCKYLFLRKSIAMKSRDINYIIKSHTQQLGCKYIYFVEKVKTEKEPRYNIYD